MGLPIVKYGGSEAWSVVEWKTSEKARSKDTHQFSQEAVTSRNDGFWKVGMKEEISVAKTKLFENSTASPDDKNTAKS